VRCGEGSERDIDIKRDVAINVRGKGEGTNKAKKKGTKRRL
jgi:hypothetical protein